MYWEGDGFLLLYKRLESGSFQWSRSGEDAQKLTLQQYRWLMEGLCIEQPKSVIAGGFASPEAIAHILTQKFVLYSPLYRQEKEWQRMGLKLTRQTMSNWVLKATKDWLEPVYDALHEKLLQSKVLHADETTVQVLREPGKVAQSKSYTR